MRAKTALLLLLVSGCATVPPPAAPLTESELAVYPDARGMPPDVQHFMVRWQGCSHWLGEPAWDGGRGRQIEEAVAELCPGIDGIGRRLRTLYSDRPEIVERLRSYEELGQ